ncbi:MAG: sugar phosphate isomerase/epimerase, partial [Terriglobus sp.]
MQVTRRNFLQLGAAAATMAATRMSFAYPLGLPIGFQSYVFRKSVATDFEGTMKSLAAAGFANVELCSPYGYSDFASLQKYKPRELHDLLKSWGLECFSAHWGNKELFVEADKSIAYAKEFGMTQMA